MDVSKHMVLGSYSLLHHLQQLHTPRPPSVLQNITVPQWGAMGHQHINAIRDEVPLLKTRLPTREVETPPTKFWLPVCTRERTAPQLGVQIFRQGGLKSAIRLPWRSPNPDSINSGLLVFEVGDILGVSNQ